MISLFIVLFLASCKEMSKPGQNAALLMAGVEYIFFLLQGMVTLQEKNLWAGMLISLIYACFVVTTCYIDIVTGFVYRFLNIIVSLIFLIIILCECNDLLVFFTDLCILLFILLICEKRKAFGHGDVEFLIVVYGHLWLSIQYNSLILLLIVMLCSCFCFGIY